MTLGDSSNMGVLACPGGEGLAKKILSALQAIYATRFDRKINALSKGFELDEEEAARQLNLTNEMIHPRVILKEKGKSNRSPSIRIHCQFTRFANGEFKTELLQSIRGKDIFILQDVANHNPLSFFGSDEKHALSVNDHLMILLNAVDTVRQGSARSITVILPCYPYSRQHKQKGREGLTAPLLGRILERMGVSRIITLDIHSQEIAHTFESLRLVNLHASYQLSRKLSSLIDLNKEDITILAPDTGAISRNRFYSGTFKKPLAILYKERDYSSVSKDADKHNITSTHLLGTVRDKVAIMADDILGTGGTLIQAMKTIKEEGARKIICLVSLPLFTPPAIDHFNKAFEEGLFDAIIGTNAVACDPEILKCPWYISADISRLFARAIFRVHNNRSISNLLDNEKLIQKLFKKDKG